MKFYYTPVEPMTKVLTHHGIIGQKWGIRRFENLDGTLTEAGKIRYSKYSKNDTVFLSGKVSYDQPISQPIRNELDRIMKAGSKVIVGDAPGADTRMQEYLAEKKYPKVIVYTADPKVRNNVGNWEVRKISSNGLTDERDVRRQKDIAMTNECTRSLAIMPEDDRPDSAMSNNIKRLSASGKLSRIYDWNQDKWFDNI